MVLHKGSTRLQTATPPTSRSTPDQHHVFQKHYSGLGSCWGSCMSMGDSVAPCFRALTSFAPALGSLCDSTQVGRLSLCSFLTEKQHLLLRLTGKFHSPLDKMLSSHCKHKKMCSCFARRLIYWVLLKAHIPPCWDVLIIKRENIIVIGAVCFKCYFSPLSLLLVARAIYYFHALSNFVQRGFYVNC